MKKLIFIVLVFLVTSCAREEGAVPQVWLVPPEGVSGELFWLGVKERLFYWEPLAGGRVVIPWETAAQVGVNFSQGGTLLFEGLSASGAVLVKGWVDILPRARKRIVLPLKRAWR